MKRYEYVTTTLREGRRVAQREAARLVRLANEGRISTERETLSGLLSANGRQEQAGHSQ